MSTERARDALVGRTLGEFVLRERIGEGGFGAVYRAIQPALDREAVIKVLHDRLGTSPQAKERFLREAKLASKLDHPYAAHVYAFGAEPDGQLWIAMELVRGTPLDQVLRLQGALSLERFVPLLDRICEVVHTAHESGIVHRDLKPANVMMLARAGRLLPKLLDFGIAKGQAPDPVGDTFESSPDPGAATLNVPALRVENLTVRGAVMGSPPYMAPEQWLDAGQVDARTDLYALGILAYECLTGKPPFTGATLTAIAQAHASQAAPPLGKGFPSALDKVIAKALAKDPRDRFTDALAFATAVRTAAGIATEVQPLPALDLALRDAVVTGMPQPIAEAVAGFEAARNAHQARDALALVGRTLARYLGLLALACRSRVTAVDAASELMRTLYRRALTDAEWLELAREATRPWTARREAHPMPELVDTFHDPDVVKHLDALASIRDAEVVGDDGVLALLDVGIAHASRALEAIAFLRDYPLVVTVSGSHAERWMGVRRAQRPTIAVRGKRLEAGVAALLDRDGAPVLTLSPLFAIAVPTPGAPLDLFMFEGRDRLGAKLVALPSGFEHHDDALWDWFRAQLTGSLDDEHAAVAEEKPPYRGLSAFSAEDAAMFVGRERQVDAFTNRLKLQPLLAVVGPSGAGKSSFVHAGVVPALGWRTLTLRPGPSPLAALTARLEHGGFEPVTDWSTTGERLPRASQRMPTMSGLRDTLVTDRDALGRMLRADAAQRGPVLVVVDQLEELFTLCQDEAERKLFAESLAAAARSVDDPVRVVFTLRDDFLVRTEQVSALRNRMSQGLQILTVPAPDDLLRIVREPARRVGYELETGLAEEMVKIVADQPGALALVSFTASKLWELRDRHFKQLTRSAYKTLGGVGGALAQHAERTLDGMPPEDRALTREAFRHLVTSQNTRAVLPRKELRQILGGDARADGVLENLVAARLVVASENEHGDETVEVIHEALLVTWPRLVEWRREDVEGTRFREQLRGAAKQWDERGRTKGLLWRGDVLGELTRWRGRHSGPLTDVEAAFTDASLADVARSRRNVRILLAAAFAVLGAVVVALILFNARVAGQRVRAETAADQLHDNLQHQYESQGRSLVLEHDPRALAYLMKAREGGAHGAANDLLVAQAVAGETGKQFELHHDNSVRVLAYSHDGARLLTGDFDSKAKLWNAATGALVATVPQPGYVFRVQFSPDDKLALSAGAGGATIFDPVTGAVVRHLEVDGKVACAQFAPDGESVWLSTSSTTIARQRVRTGDELARIVAPGDVARCALAEDGSSVAAYGVDDQLWIWDATGQHPRALASKDHLNALAFSPDGTRLVTASDAGNATIWDVAAGVSRLVLPHDGSVSSAEFSRDGTRIATSSRDRTAAIWDATSGARLVQLVGHAGALNRAVFSPDGKHVATTSVDATARLWNVATGAVEARWHGHEELVFNAAFDPSGAHVATVGDDGRAIIWNAVPQEDVTRLDAKATVNDIAFSNAGTRVVTAGADGFVRIWDQQTGRELVAIPIQTRARAVFGPGDHLIAVIGTDGQIRFFDAGTGAQVGEPLVAARASQTQLAWSRDGATLAVTAGDELQCWNVATRALRFDKRGHGGAGIATVAFDPAGTSLATTGDDKQIRVWDLDGKERMHIADDDVPIDAVFDATGRRLLETVQRQRVKIRDLATGVVGPVLVGHVGYINSAQWSANDAFAITGGFDGTARLWDAATGNMLVVFEHSGLVRSATFSPDDRRVAVAGDGGWTEIHTLPVLALDAAALAKFARCRIPHAISANGDVVPRTIDPTDCD